MGQRRERDLEFLLHLFTVTHLIKCYGSSGEKSLGTEDLIHPHSLAKGLLVTDLGGVTLCLSSHSV